MPSSSLGQLCNGRWFSGFSRFSGPQTMITVLFACVHNAGRSQMAAAWFNALADPMKSRATSAGTHPGSQVHPSVVEAMREAGIDVVGARPQRLTDALASQAQWQIGRAHV